MTPITVYELNEYVRQRMAEDPILSRVYVEGEISGLKRHSSGHMYFTLKDDRAQINCVYFAGDQRRGFIPADGMKVIVGGDMRGMGAFSCMLRISRKWARGFYIFSLSS